MGMKEVGTLQDLGVKIGDVVECVEWFGEFYTVGKKYSVIEGWGERYISIGTKDSIGLWRIVSRASDTPKLWRDMTPEEKGELFLAYHVGKEIEIWDGIEWLSVDPEWRVFCAYRVKPEPKVEVVTLMTGSYYGWSASTDGIISAHETHKITFTLIDGNPDCASIKMEEL